MKNVFYKFVIVTVLLSGCSSKSTSDDLTDIATGTVNNMYNSVPKECQTVTLKNLRDTSIEQIKAINKSCKDKEALMQAKINERNIIILAFSVIILLYVGVKLSSKFRL